MRTPADVEFRGGKGAALKAGKHSVVEQDLVLGHIEVGDLVDIAGIEGGFEDKDIRAPISRENVFPATAVDVVVAGIAIYGLGELVSFEIDGEVSDLFVVARCSISDPADNT